MHKTIVTSLLALCALVALPRTAAADDYNFAKHWASSIALTQAVADAMPADGYDFVPPSTVEPKEMSFGALMVHIVQADTGAFARVSGMKPPAKPATTDKAAVTAYMKEGFEFCTTALASLDAEKMAKSYGPEGRQMTGSEILLAYFTHTAHHRGQAEVYLRLKGVKPPAYTF